MRMLKQLFLLTIFLSAAAPAQTTLPTEDAVPEIRRYTVEIVVFRYAQEVSTGTEIFPPQEIEIPVGFVLGPDGEVIEDPLLAGTLAGDEPPDPAEPTAPEPEEDPAEPGDAPDEPVFELVVLDEDDYTMTEIVERLDTLDVYELMLHAAWTQTAFPEEATPAIDIREFGVPPDDLAGTFTLYLGRYLHLVVDLSLLAPAELQPPGVAAPTFDEPMMSYADERQMSHFDVGIVYPTTVYAPLRYRIHENRILRNEETRYYDHPKFGVIARVLRYEEPEEDEQFPDDTQFLLPGDVAE